jgi:hypothetical protein
MAKVDPSRPIRTLFTREFLSLIRNAKVRALEELRPMLQNRTLDVAELMQIINSLNLAYIDRPGAMLILKFITQAYQSGITNTTKEIDRQMSAKTTRQTLIQPDLAIGIDFNRYDQKFIDNMSAVTLSDLHGFTAEMSKKIVRDIVEADKQGSSITNFNNIIQEHYQGIGYVRAETIARTVTTQAHNNAAWSRAKEYAPYKEWIPTLNSSRTRPSHLAMKGVIVPIDEPFHVPAFMASKNSRVEACDMMFPGDSSLGAPAGQIIQCRCALAPSFKRPKPI